MAYSYAPVQKKGSKMMTKEKKGQTTADRTQTTQDGQAREVEAVYVPKWIPILQPVLPASETQDRTVKLECPGCGAKLRISSRNTVKAWLRGKGLPICPCGHRYNTDFVDAKTAKEPVPYVEPKTAQADDSSITLLNQIKLAREKLHALKEIHEPSSPKIKAALAHLEALLERME